MKDYEKSGPFGATVLSRMKSTQMGRLKNLIESFSHQVLQDKQLVLVIDVVSGDVVDEVMSAVKSTILSESSDITVLVHSGPVFPFHIASSLCRLLQLADEHTTIRHHFITEFYPSYEYGPHFLDDQLDAFIYTDATIVGKSRHFER
mmetsp:Transcript_4981/g.10689  ORF Transcript_4981/g.10689 Transcript_4981/m.10689 type:complete len:147 (+) Transcript_4981:140-580(+)